MCNELDMNVSRTPSTPAFAIVSGVPSTPTSSMVWILENISLNISTLVVSSQPMRMNPFVFPGGSPIHGTHSMHWASNPFSFGMPNMTLHLSSYVLTSDMNPSFGFGGKMSPYVPFSFGGVHIPQPTPTVGGWNTPSSGPNPNFNAPGWSAQMGSQFTSYIPSFIPSSSTSVLMNTFIMEKPPLSSGVLSRGNQFHSMGNP